MKNAVLRVISGDKCLTVAREYGIPNTTLQDKVKVAKKTLNGTFLIKKTGAKPVFNHFQE